MSEFELKFHVPPEREEALAAAAGAIPAEPWQLGAVSAITSLTGSALLALAMAQGRLSAEDAWAAAHVDEDWNIHQWGDDEQALERRAARKADPQFALGKSEAGHPLWGPVYKRALSPAL